ncbi:hypothetical protein FRB96_007431 [Tulasnella sp. 330]|nr:hypothetical protein FRB96_007431 [Tulasnella sp. 330]KAG8872765.1 hypothetical protein FRB97_007361 [Tulasnella sp. 331]KAG8876660.1 hypothetical protein FRB98_007094 [Tulasnella sp. 332]
MDVDNRLSKHSIEHALDLEHALNSEDHSSEPEVQPENLMLDDNRPNGEEEKYDPEILTSIIIQLRATLAKMTHERDESNEALAEAGHKYASLEAKTADLAEMLTQEKERGITLEAERDQAVQSAKENEEQVNMLRAKVEESRRGVMRLQAESRRVSTQITKSNGPLPLDLSAPARSPGLASPFSATTNKRQSFQVGPRPLLSGQGHRRISSMSDPGMAHEGDAPPVPPMPPLPVPLGVDGLPPSPATHTFSSGSGPDLTSAQAKANWRRVSMIVKKRDLRSQSPPNSNTLAPAPPNGHQRSISPPVPNSDAIAAEVELLKSELNAMKKELETVTRDLEEANDAKEAADACAKALREFIAEQSIGVVEDPPAPTSSSQQMGRRGSSSSSQRGWGDPAVNSPGRSLKGIKLPPLPTDNNIPEEVASSNTQAKAKGSWSLGLWKEKIPDASLMLGAGGLFASASPTPGSTATMTDPNGTSSGATPLTSFVSSWTRGVTSTASATASTMVTPGQNSSNPETVSIASSSGDGGPSLTATPPTTGLRKFSFFSSKAAPPVAAPATNAPVASAVPSSARSSQMDVQSLSGNRSVGLTSMSESTTTTEEPVSPKSHGGDAELGFTSVVLSDGNEGQDHDGQTLEISHNKMQGDATPTMANTAVGPLKHM